MGRLIDAFALQEEYKKRHDGKRLLLIDVAPPVDAVEVVRCRECRWCNMGECEHKFGLLVSNDENYCSYGERDVDI